MSTDNRKPLAVFVLLAVAAVVLMVQRADAEAGRWFEAAGGAIARAHGAVFPDAAGSRPTGPTAGPGPDFGAVAEPRPNRAGPDRGLAGGSADPGNRPDPAVSRDEPRRALRGHDPGELRRRDHAAGRGAHHARESRGTDGPRHAHRARTNGRAGAEGRGHEAQLQRDGEQPAKHEG